MEIRDAEPLDQVALRQVVTRAFGRDEVAGLVDALEADGCSRASLVAVEDDVLGHVQLSHSWLDTRERLVDVLVLSPLSVEPGRQGAGVGTALVAAALARAEDLGAALVFLEGSPDYYGPRGFEHAEPLGLERPSARIPSGAFQVALLPSYDGAPGRLVYCETFWRLDLVGLRDPRLAEVEAHFAGRDLAFEQVLDR